MARTRRVQSGKGKQAAKAPEPVPPTFAIPSSDDESDDDVREARKRICNRVPQAAPVIEETAVPGCAPTWRLRELGFAKAAQEWDEQWQRACSLRDADGAWMASNRWRFISKPCAPPPASTAANEEGVLAALDEQYERRWEPGDELFYKDDYHSTLVEAVVNGPITGFPQYCCVSLVGTNEAKWVKWDWMNRPRDVPVASGAVSPPEALPAMEEVEAMEEVLEEDSEQPLALVPPARPSVPGALVPPLGARASASEDHTGFAMSNLREASRLMKAAAAACDEFEGAVSRKEIQLNCQHSAHLQILQSSASTASYVASLLPLGAPPCPPAAAAVAAVAAKGVPDDDDAAPQMETNPSVALEDPHARMQAVRAECFRDLKIGEIGEMDPGHQPKTRLLDSDDPLLAQYVEGNGLDRLLHFAHDKFANDMDANSKYTLARILHRSLTTDTPHYGANVASLLKWHRAETGGRVAPSFLFVDMCGFSTNGTNRTKRKEAMDFCKQIQALYELAARKLDPELAG